MTALAAIGAILVIALVMLGADRALGFFDKNGKKRRRS
jgi:hypothetical protein